jgi:GNAT superfamily N-acetyltransferase
MCFDERVELIEFGQLTERRRRELEGDEQDPWDAGDVPLLFRPKERHVGLRNDRGRLIASAGTVTADVEVAGNRFAVVGLGGVIVNAAYRGRGLAREVVTAAVARAEQFGPEFMLLFCHPDRAGLYRKLGFAEVDATVTVEQPDGDMEMPMMAMWRALRPGVSWPEGSVAVSGLPF